MESVPDRFQQRLQREFDERRGKNARYSLRSFAAHLGADHSTLSQVLRGRRRAPAAHIRAWAKKLGLTREETAAYIAAEQLPDPLLAARESQVRHWTAEAMEVIGSRTHWQIWSLSHEPQFRNDCRWIAARIGVTVDEVQVAFTRLLRLGVMATGAAGEWIPRLEAADESDFRERMLSRIREMSKEMQRNA